MTTGDELLAIGAEDDAGRRHLNAAAHRKRTLPCGRKCRTARRGGVGRLGRRQRKIGGEGRADQGRLSLHGRDVAPGAERQGGPVQTAENSDLSARGTGEYRSGYSAAGEAERGRPLACLPADAQRSAEGKRNLQRDPCDRDGADETDDEMNQNTAHKAAALDGESRGGPEHNRGDQRPGHPIGRGETQRAGKFKRLADRQHRGNGQRQHEPDARLQEEAHANLPEAVEASRGHGNVFWRGGGQRFNPEYRESPVCPRWRDEAEAKWSESRTRWREEIFCPWGGAPAAWHVRSNFRRVRPRRVGMKTSRLILPERECQPARSLPLVRRRRTER